MKMYLRTTGLCLALVFFCKLTLAQTQTVNLSTGWNANTSSMIPFGNGTANQDDTWQVMPPGYWTFVPSYVSSGIYQTVSNPPLLLPYPCQPSQARWTSPWVNASGVITAQAGTLGMYVYRATFYLNHTPCELINTAKLEFNNISADNAITKVRINGTDYNLNPTINFQSGCTSLVITIANPSSVLQSGVNTVEMYVDNQSSVTGIVLDGSLKVWASGFPIPLSAAFNWMQTQPFCSGSPIVVDGSASTGPIVSHTWEIRQADANCNVIPAGTAWGFNWIAGQPGAIDLTNLPDGIALQCGWRYLIQLKVKDACGNEWHSMVDCIEVKCSPDLSLDGSTIEICMGASPGLAITSSCGSCMVDVKNLTTNASEYYGPPNISTMLNPITANTTYQVTIYGANGCSKTINWPVYVMTNTIPVSFTGSASWVCVNNFFPLSVDASGYWNFNACTMTIVEQSSNATIYSGPPSIAIMMPPLMNSPETYVITVTDTETGCMSVYQWTVTAIICSVGGGGGDDNPGKWSAEQPYMDSEHVSAFHLFPNPGTGVVNLLSDGRSGVMEVYDALGRKVTALSLSATQDQYILDLSQEPKGIYSVRIISGGQTYWQKLVIR